MRSGVKVKDITIGTGEEALRGKTVVADVRMFLNQGTELPMLSRIRIDLGHRECIAGLRYGIEGMRVGGRRQLIISPHLAYGEEGVAGLIPANAVLRCEVELLEVRESGALKPEDYPADKYLSVFHPGEAARNLARWQFVLYEDGRGGVAITQPVPNVHWRHARVSHVERQFDETTTRQLFDEVFELPKMYSNDCFTHDELWADSAERGNSITRAKRDNILCFTVSVMERGQWLCYYSIAETSQALIECQFFRVICGLVEGHLGQDAPGGNQ